VVDLYKQLLKHVHIKDWQQSRMAVDIAEGPISRQQTLLLARVAEAMSVPFKLHYRNASARHADNGAGSASDGEQ
jgi:hypothetical protein